MPKLERLTHVRLTYSMAIYSTTNQTFDCQKGTSRIVLNWKYRFLNPSINPVLVHTCADRDGYQTHALLGLDQNLLPPREDRACKWMNPNRSVPLATRTKALPQARQSETGPKSLPNNGPNDDERRRFWFVSGSYTNCVWISNKVFPRQGLSLVLNFAKRLGTRTCSFLRRLDGLQRVRCRHAATHIRSRSDMIQSSRLRLLVIVIISKQVANRAAFNNASLQLAPDWLTLPRNDPRRCHANTANS